MTSLYRTVWRWHFYAGLLVMPMIVVLSLSGALYLFKPQVERWEERAFHGLPTAGAVSPSEQVVAVRTALPGMRFASYRLPERAGDAATVRMTSGGGKPRDVFVSPQGRVLGNLDPDARIIAWDRKVHGQLLMGRKGSWLVELAASWAIVMVLTGLYLWWPRDRRGLGGVLYPRFGLPGRAWWRDLHAVTGFWVAGLALVMLATGLPWADAWASAFKAVRTELGWIKGTQDWTVGGKPSSSPEPAHDHAAMGGGMAMQADSPRAFDAAMFNTMVARAQKERLVFPAFVVPPGAPAGEGGTGRPATGWVVKSEAQNRPLRVVLRYEAMTGELGSREDFSTRHPIDKVIAVGVAWHEGQLAGWANQLVGASTAAMLLTLASSGLVMWWRRRPEGELGAPPWTEYPRLGLHVRLAIALLGVLLPLFTVSLMALWLLDRVVIARWAHARRWLGLGHAASGT